MDDRKQLTVGQLIRLLKGFPEDMPVYADDMAISFFRIVGAVEERIKIAAVTWETVCTLQGAK